MRSLCPICDWSVSQLVRIAGTLAVHLRGNEGVPDAPLRQDCPVCMWATGVVDDHPAAFVDACQSLPDVGRGD
jgi:hypothetical protein